MKRKTIDPVAFDQKAIIAETYTTPVNIQGIDELSCVFSWDNGDGSQEHEVIPEFTNDNPTVEGSTVKYAPVNMNPKDSNTDGFVINGGAGNSGSDGYLMKGVKAKFLRYRIKRSAGQVDIRIKTYGEETRRVD